MRKKDNTLHEMLLNSARDIASTNGTDAINIRSIAQKAGVATGTVYNYFSNKDEILLALTEEYWKKTLLEAHTEITAESFYGQLEEIFTFLKKRIDNSAGILMRSLENVQIVGQERMKSMQMALGTTIIQRMEQDKNIRQDIWNETFTKDQFANFIIMNMMLLLRSQVNDISFLVELVKRTIY